MLIDGKKIAGEIQEELKDKIAALQGKKPGLAFILVGHNPASLSYVKAKKKACTFVGIHSVVIELPQSIAESDLLKQIEKLNQNSEINGILVQLPLPSHIDEKIVTAAIDPKKDVDGFHPMNVGKMLLGDNTGLLPCTPLGIQELLIRSHIPIEGKHVVIVGRSNIVGKPLAAMLMQKKPHCNATVTIAHSQSKHLNEITRSADVVVAALGRPFFLKKGMVKPGSTVIDVGINRLPDGKLVGDVDFEAVKEVAENITPVPGGVGPMTIAMLLKNTLQAFFLLLFVLTSCQKSPLKDPCTHFEGWSMTMPYHVIIGKPLSIGEKKAVKGLIDQTFREIHEVFDNWNPSSEVSRLNQASKEALIPLSPSLEKLLTLCNQIVKLSGGRYDPTMEPLIRLWRENKKPTPQQLQAISDSIGWDHISIQNGIFKKDDNETRLDLCSISKGLGIDWIVEKLQKLGYKDVLVEWAGEVRAIGHHPENRDWTVQIDPGLQVQNQPIAPIPLRNNAIATSGNQNRHIIDPLTAAPVESTVASVTVIAPTCALADALATAAMLYHTRKEAESFAQEVVDLYPDVSFWILSHRNP